MSTAKPKTYKREKAVVHAALWWALTGFAAWAMVFAPSANHAALKALVIGSGIYVFGFAAGAWGMDWWAKQKPFAIGKDAT